MADASTEPGVFSPLCGFSGELVLRGGGCKVAFGWYNANASGTRPPDNQIYELIPADTSTAFRCEDNDFCPLATMETTQAGQHDWTPRQFSAADIRNDRRYQGGLVGFALIGKAGTYCTQTKFSQRELNTVCTSCTPNAPWVTTLIYTSTGRARRVLCRLRGPARDRDELEGEPGRVRERRRFQRFRLLHHGRDLQRRRRDLRHRPAGRVRRGQDGLRDRGRGRVPARARARRAERDLRQHRQRLRRRGRQRRGALRRGLRVQPRVVRAVLRARRGRL